MDHSISPSFLMLQWQRFSLNWIFAFRGEQKTVLEDFLSGKDFLTPKLALLRVW